MPVEFRPLLEDGALCYCFSGAVTQADLAHLGMQEEAYFQTLPPGACLYIVADVVGLDTIAAALFPQLQHLRLARETRVCLVCVVGANPYLRALLLSLGMGATRPRFLFHATLDDAVAAIRAHRATTV